jgi:hypothetical protein
MLYIIMTSSVLRRLNILLFKIIVFFIITLCGRLYVRVGILLTWKLKRVHDRIISLRGKVWAHKTRFTPPLFIEVPVSNQEDERSCICELVISTVPLSTISYPTVWYCLFFVYGV